MAHYLILSPEVGQWLRICLEDEPGIIEVTAEFLDISQTILFHY